MPWTPYIIDSDVKILHTEKIEIYITVSDIKHNRLSYWGKNIDGTLDRINRHDTVQMTHFPYTDKPFICDKHYCQHLLHSQAEA